MPDRRQVDPDLVRSPGPDLDLQQRESFESFDHAIRRVRLAARFEPRRHPRPPHRIAGDLPVYASCVPGDNALHQRKVRFFDGPRRKLSRQFAMRRVVPRRQHHA